MAWRIYSQTVLFLNRIREQFRNLLHQPRQYSRLLHRYQYRISRTLWLIKLTLLAVPLILQGRNLVREWKKFRTLVQ